MVRLSDLPFPLPVPLVQTWLYIPGEAAGDPGSLSSKIAAGAGRPTRTVGYLVLAILAMFTVCPPGTMTDLSPSRMNRAQLSACALIAGRTLFYMVVFFGGWHTWLYGNGGKPLLAKLEERKFNQKDGAQGYNVLRDCCATTWGTLISVAYEILLLHCCDTGVLTLDGYRHEEGKVSLSGEEQEQAFLGVHAVRNLAVLLLLPYWVEAHFYAGHRLLHFKPIYPYIHKFHHAALNPGPWSGLSMHPAEHVIFFSACLLPFVVPVRMHLLHVIFILTYTRISPIGGHDGYDKPCGGSLVHYLHHTKFTVNYGTPVVPFDKWFGTLDEGLEYRAKTGLRNIDSAPGTGRKEQ